MKLVVCSGCSRHTRSFLPLYGISSMSNASASGTANSTATSQIRVTSTAFHRGIPIPFTLLHDVTAWYLHTQSRVQAHVRKLRRAGMGEGVFVCTGQCWGRTGWAPWSPRRLSGWTASAYTHIHRTASPQQSTKPKHNRQMQHLE